MRISAAVALCFGIWILSACAPQDSTESSDLGAMEQQIREFEAAYAAAVVTGNIDEILQFYSPDIISLPPGEPIQRGREWLRGVLDTYYQDFDFKEEFKIIDFRSLEDRLAVTLEYRAWGTIKADGTPFEEIGKGLAILNQSSDGRWQFEWNCWSPSAPAEAGD